MRKSLGVFFFVAMVSSIISCSQGSRYDYLIMQNNSAFEIQILKGKEVIINQKHWPILAGNQSISSKKEAEKLANLFIKKLEKGIFPPTITPEEVEDIRLLNY